MTTVKDGGFLNLNKQVLVRKSTLDLTPLVLFVGL